MVADYLGDRRLQAVRVVRFGAVVTAHQVATLLLAANNAALLSRCLVHTLDAEPANICLTCT